MRALAIVALATGCTRILGVHDFPPEVDETKTCYGTMFPICFATALPDPRSLSNAIDTDDTLCRGTLSDGTPACVIAATDLTVSDVRVHGSLPLVLIAEDMLTITGTLDAASHDGVIGPGGDSAACIPGTPGWGQDPSTLRGSAGGAGGSFGSIGGAGANAQPYDLMAGQIGGGKPGPIATTIALRGGCAGSAGGVPPASAVAQNYPMVVPAIGGHGGGAVLLVAGAIEIDGAIDASGGGGAPGMFANQGKQIGTGGAGGGAGGLIALDAMMIGGGGLVVANGGGGGAGASHDSNAVATAGDDGGPPLDSVAAGGADSIGGGAGGAGAGRTSAATIGQASSSQQDSGSGGGGGGVGMILSRVQFANASPTATPP